MGKEDPDTDFWVKTLPRKKRNPIKTLKNKIWELCKQKTREKYGMDCYTCERKELKGSDCHTGHFIPSGSCGLFLRYDLRNLRPQCYNCNINLGGNGAVFAIKMIRVEGSDYVDLIFRDKNLIVKEKDFLPKKLEELRSSQG